MTHHSGDTTDKEELAGSGVSKGLHTDWRWFIRNLVPLVGLGIAAFVSVRGLFRIYFLKAFIPPPNEDDLYRVQIADLLGPWMILACAVAAVGLMLLFLYRPRGFVGTKPVGVAITVALLIGISMATTLWAQSRLEVMLEPFRPEVAALNSFPAPAEWRGPEASGHASLHPRATRIWQVSQGSLQQACLSARRALEAWADPNSTVEKPPFSGDPCLFAATKGPDDVTEVRVSSAGNVTVTLVRRAELHPDDLRLPVSNS